MRGTPDFVIVKATQGGIIPAYAGNTFCKRIRCFGTRDHPRVCGEHCQTVIQTRQSVGSSPRMRGTPGLNRPTKRSCGIIPAYAGNTIINSPYNQERRDHPRVCGEHSRSTRCCRPSTGSSPRMRGTRRNGHYSRGGYGIIPAYAGNTQLIICLCAV